VSWWRSLAPFPKVAVALLAGVAAAGALYFVLTLVLIGLANLGIGDG
jgi:hypothetical protein